MDLFRSEPNKRRAHTILSFCLGCAGLIAILFWVLPVPFLPIRFLPLVRGFYYILPLSLLFGSLKTMKWVEGKITDRERVIRRVAVYTRFAAVLLMLAPFGLFSHAWTIHTPYSVKDYAFFVAVFVLSATAIIFSTLDVRVKIRNARRTA